VLVFTFTPNPVSPVPPTTTCSEGVTPFKTWNFQMTIQNTSAIPFSLASWTFGPNGIVTTSKPNSEFMSTFGTTTIPANGQVSGATCVFHSTAPSGQVQYTLVGTNGNGPHTSGFVTLLAAAPEFPFVVAPRR
jgi:hypothetical protein